MIEIVNSFKSLRWEVIDGNGCQPGAGAWVVLINLFLATFQAGSAYSGGAYKKKRVSGRVWLQPLRGEVMSWLFVLQYSALRVSLSLKTVFHSGGHHALRPHVDHSHIFVIYIILLDLLKEIIDPLRCLGLKFHYGVGVQYFASP